MADDSSDSDVSGDELLEAKVLPSRKTRGTRDNKLVGEAEEADDEFWGQDAFKEDGADTDFSEQSEAATTEPSDTDISDDEPTEEENIRQAARRSAGAGASASSGGAFADDGDGRKRGVYVDPAMATGARAKVSGLAAAERRSRQSRLVALLGADKAKAVIRSLADADAAAASAAASSSSSSSAAAPGADAGVRARLEAIKALRAKAREAAGSRPSQEDVIRDSARTTLSNLASLEALLRASRAQETSTVRGARAGIPGERRIRRRWSAKEGATLTFVGADEVPACLLAGEEPAPEEAVCEVTGARARYRHPSTGRLFASAEAARTAGVPPPPPDPVSAAGSAAMRASEAGPCRAAPVAPVPPELFRFPL